jgi:glycosyltransferase involved in cell wall biosynthesis
MTRTLRVALLTLGDPGQLTGGYLYHRRLAEAAPAHDASLAFLSYPARPFPLPALATSRLRSRLRAPDADVLVLDSIAAAFWGAWPARDLEIPLVGMLHQPPGGIDHGPVRALVQARLDRRAYRQAKLLLAASESLAHDLARDPGISVPVRVVPPGRDVPPPARVGLDLRAGRACAVLSIGNWLPRKGILDLVEALSRLPEGLVTLHLAGDDLADVRYAKKVHARLGQADLWSRAVVHGPLSREEIASLYAAADVFALASYREPYGTVYGEAMAAGLPVVGWRAGNLPYLAEHERQGMLVAPGDVTGLTAALRRLAEEPDLRRRMGQAGKERAVSRPTWNEVAEMFFAALREVVDAR